MVEFNLDKVANFISFLVAKSLKSCSNPKTDFEEQKLTSQISLHQIIKHANTDHSRKVI